jgi:hypothetical protein
MEAIILGEDSLSPESPNLPLDQSTLSDDSMDSPRWNDLDSIASENNEDIDKREPEEGERKRLRQRQRRLKHADSLNALVSEPDKYGMFMRSSKYKSGISSTVDLYQHTRHLVPTPSSVEKARRSRRRQKEQNVSLRSALPSTSFAVRKRTNLRSSKKGQHYQSAVRVPTVSRPYDESFPLTDELIDDAIAYLTT